MVSVKEILLSETDGSCAYCGIRDYRILTVHHIVQQEPKDESWDNKILLCYNCHDLYNKKKGPSEKDILTIKKRLICKTLTQQGVNALKKAYKNKIVIASPILVNHLIELQLLKQSNTILSYADEEKGEMVGFDIEAVYKLTDEGKKFVEKWNILGIL